MYRNYDGQKATFGETSVYAGGPNPDATAVFAAERASDGALTLMIVSKPLSGTTSATITLAGFVAAGSAEVWQLTGNNAIVRLADVTVTGGRIALSLPAQSVTMLVAAGGGGANQPPVALATATPVSGNAPLAVAFDGAGSSDTDGTIVSWAWSFGDGATATGSTAGHTYTGAGTYTATLTVTDDHGAAASTSVGISVAQAPDVVAPPGNLTGSVASRRVTLHWDGSANEGGFYIERAAKTRGSLAWSRVGEVGANVTAFSQDLSRGVWLYRVQAFSQSRAGVSAYSNQAQVRVR